MQGHTVTRASWFSKYVPKAGDGCVLWFPGQDDEQSATIRDRSGQGNNGTIVGATWVRLPSGLWCLSFDGADDYVTIALDSSFNFTDEPFSCEMWVYPLAMAAYEDIISTGTSNVAGWCWEVRANTGEFWFKSYYPTGLYSARYGAGTIEQDKWLHLVSTKSGTTVKFYKNGVEQTQTSSNIPATLTASATATKLGEESDSTAYDWEGYMALPRIYKNRILSAQEILNHFYRERHLFGV